MLFKRRMDKLWFKASWGSRVRVEVVSDRVLTQRAGGLYWGDGGVLNLALGVAHRLCSTCTHKNTCTHTDKRKLLNKFTLRR